MSNSTRAPATGDHGAVVGFAFMELTKPLKNGKRRQQHPSLGGFVPHCAGMETAMVHGTDATVAIGPIQKIEENVSEAHLRLLLLVCTFYARNHRFSGHSLPCRNLPLVEQSSLSQPNSLSTS